MNKITTALISSMSALIMVTTVVHAAETTITKTTTCTEQYGGGKVCGTTTDEKIVHEPVDAALGDNPITLILSLLGASGALFFLSKRALAV